jgi:hypothetical protein
MDFPKHSGSRPALLLIKEIDILQARIRSMEICLKQAQPVGEDRMTRMEQHYNRELAGLRAALTSVEQILGAGLQLLEPLRFLEAQRRIQEEKFEPDQTGQIASNRRPNQEITTEEFTMDMEDRNKQLAGNPIALQESGTAPYAVEQSLRNEIDRLLHEAQEKNRILQDRNDELVRVKAEMDRLQERLNQVESSTSRAQSAIAGDVERMHTEFQAQLALLQAELSQKEWALEDKQAAARGLEQKYREEIESLRRQLAQREINQLGDEFVSDEPRRNRAQQEPFAPPENGDLSAGTVNLRKSQRRWHSGGGSKRRWRE